MTNMYRILSISYRIQLLLISGVYLTVCQTVADFEPDEIDPNPWLLLPYSILTVVLLTVFHRCDRVEAYRKIIRSIVCILVCSSLAGLVFFIISVLQTGDSNLLVNAILLILTSVNAGLLFYLVQDR